MAKVVIVLNSAWNVFNFRLPLLNYLQKEGHEISVVAPEDEYKERIPFDFYSINFQSKSINPIKDIWLFLKFLFLFSKIKPDILLLYTIKPNVYANLAAGLLGIKTVSNVAGLGSLFINPSVVTQIAKYLYKFSLRYSCKVFFQNSDDRSIFVAENIVDERVTNILPGSGVDLERFSARKTNITRKNNGKIVFLLASRMLWDKGVKEFVAAGNKLLDERDDVVFQLLGFLDSDNPAAITSEDMQKLVSRDGIVYLGVSDVVERELGYADCVVLPSYREGTPRTLLEAGAMGKPIITTDVTGCRDVVDDGVNGFLCKPRDVDDLYSKMKKMIEIGDAQRAQLGENSRRKISTTFDQEIVFNKYAQAIAECCV